jgi:hypothetical protein
MSIDESWALRDLETLLGPHSLNSEPAESHLHLTLAAVVAI